jgi:hypothetical protein
MASSSSCGAEQMPASSSSCGAEQMPVRSKSAKKEKKKEKEHERNTWIVFVRSRCGTFESNHSVVENMGMTVKRFKELIAKEHGIEPDWISMTCDEVTFFKPEEQLMEPTMVHMRIHANEQVIDCAKRWVQYRAAHFGCKYACEMEGWTKPEDVQARIRAEREYLRQRSEEMDRQLDESLKALKLSIEQQQQPQIFGLPPAPTDEDVELNELRNEALMTVDRNRKRPSKQEQAKLWNDLRYNLEEFERVNDTQVTMAAKRRRCDGVTINDDDCGAVKLLLEYCGREWSAEDWRNALMHPEISVEILTGIKSEVMSRASTQADRAHKVLRCIPLFKNIEVFMETIATQRPLNAT